MSSTITPKTPLTSFKDHVRNQFDEIIATGEGTIISEIPSMVDKADPEIIQNISVSYKGTKMPLREIAYITSPVVNSFTIKMLEPALWQATVDALLAADVPLLVHDYRPEYLEVTYPPISEQGRKERLNHLDKLGRHYQKDLHESYAKLRENILKSDISDEQKKNFIQELEHLHEEAHNQLLSFLQGKIKLLNSLK